MSLPTFLLLYRRWRLLLMLAVGNLLILKVLSSSNEISPYASISAVSSHSLFGVRGGGFFGFGRLSKTQGDGGGGDDDEPKRYSALSRDEIEEKLNIPVFGLTDANGNGVILSDNGHNIFHFFFSKHMADAALKAVTAANAGVPELKVSAFHLGKCWFNLINKSRPQEFTLTKYGMDVDVDKGEFTRPVHFRLVPNMKDLMGARILTGLKPGDIDQLRDAVEEPNPPKALSIIQNAANSETSCFNSPFNEIPVFAIAQMRVRKRGQDGTPIGNNMMPFHLSTKTMSETWDDFLKQSPQFEGADATLQLVELHKMIDLMQHESDFDFRNIVFIQPDYDIYEQSTDYMEDSDDDDSDDGGAGDNGMKANNSSDYEKGSIEPFVSMEIFADAPEEILVQL